MPIPNYNIEKKIGDDAWKANDIEAAKKLMILLYLSGLAISIL